MGSSALLLSLDLVAAASPLDKLLIAIQATGYTGQRSLVIAQTGRD